MDGVPAARCQEAHGLGDDLPLVLVGLDGEHGLAHDQVGARVRQARGRGVGDDVLGVGVLVEDRGHLVAALGVGVDGAVGGGATGQQQLGCAPDAGAELDDALARLGSGRGQETAGQANAAGSQDALAEAGQKPVALHAGGLGAGAGAVGPWRGAGRGRQLFLHKPVKMS